MLIKYIFNKGNMMEVIGIIGGVGPMATAQFYTHLCEKVAHHTEGQIPELIIYNLPTTVDELALCIDSKLAYVQEKISTLLYKALTYFKKLGIKIVVMPCNTLQILLQPLCDQLGIININVVKETVKQITTQKFSAPLIVATASTYKYSHYLTFLEQQKIKGIYLTGTPQLLIEQYIIDVVKQPHIDHEIRLKSILQEALHHEQADCIVLACTDLILNNHSLNVPIINSVHVALETTAQLIYTENNIKVIFE